MDFSICHPVLRVRIKTEGPLAVLGHDRIFDQPVIITAQTGPNGFDGASVRAEGDLRQTTVTGAISDGDRIEMLRRKDVDMFETHKYPRFVFAGTYKESFRLIEGKLDLHGAQHMIRLPVTVVERAGGWVVEGQIRLDLRPFGIKPFKAMLGALRVSPEVLVDFSAEVVDLQAKLKPKT